MKTGIHLANHVPGGDEVLGAAYGVAGEEQHRRLRVHRALLLAEQHTWVTGDRPPGWQRSPAGLEDRLAVTVRS